MKPHVFHPEASEEYTQAIQYYTAVMPELGGRFHDEIERLIGLRREGSKIKIKIRIRNEAAS